LWLRKALEEQTLKIILANSKRNYENPSDEMKKIVSPSKCGMKMGNAPKGNRERKTYLF
jgi:hypothetical protein